MNIILETKRFYIRELLESDVDGFFELDSDPEVHRYLGREPVTDKNKLLDVIKYVQKQYIDNGIGRWAIIDKGTNKFIGWTGLKLVKENINNQTNYFDLGYRLIRKYWGKGIATETAKASIDYGFNVLKLKEIIATIHYDNVASNNVARKLGFEFIETFDFEGDLHNWYKLENK